MNIAFIVPSLANKGPVIVVKSLCEGLSAAGHRCKVFYFDPIEELAMPCPCERIRFRSGIDFTRWDVVHSHMLRPDLWVWLHKPLSDKKRPLFITTIHQNIRQTLSSDYGKTRARFFTHIWHLLLHRQDKIAVLTAEHIKSLPRGLKSRAAILFNGRTVDTGMDIDAEDKIRIDALKRRYTVIGTTSIITRRKGLEQIINALEYLPGYAYIAVGDGPELDRLKRLAADKNVGDRCLWLGNKPEGHRYTRYYDIYAIPSRSEGFPLSLIEAAAYAKPTLCSDIAIFRSIVDNRQVVFCPPDAPRRFARAAELALANGDALSAELHAFYRSALTREIMCQNYIKLYASLSVR